MSSWIFLKSSYFLRKRRMSFWKSLIFLCIFLSLWKDIVNDCNCWFNEIYYFHFQMKILHKYGILWNMEFSEDSNIGYSQGIFCCVCETARGRSISGYGLCRYSNPANYLLRPNRLDLLFFVFVSSIWCFGFVRRRRRECW